MNRAVKNLGDVYKRQYEFFHYVELCEYLKKDVVALKARAVGFSEIGASLGLKAAAHQI